MTVHVDTSGHDDKPGSINHSIRSNDRINRSRIDLPVNDPNVSTGTGNAVSRVVNGTVSDKKRGHFSSTAFLTTSSGDLGHDIAIANERNALGGNCVFECPTMPGRGFSIGVQLVAVSNF